MFKKMILVAVVGALAVAAFKSTRVGSYVRNELRSIREAAEDQVSPEQEIARLRGEVKLLDDDTLKVVKQLARLQSDQADLEARHKGLQARAKETAARKDALAAEARAAEAKEKAGEATAFVVFNDHRYSLAAAKLKLKDLVQAEKDLAKELAVVQAKLDSQQRIVDKLEAQRLEAGRLKSTLETTIDELEVEYQTLKLKQMESKYQTDGSRAAEIKESVAKLRKRLDVQRRELAMLQDGEAPAGEAAVAESVDEIVGGGKAKAGSAVAATPAMPPAKE
jgi:chromosome segregation ATPase